MQAALLCIPVLSIDAFPQSAYIMHSAIEALQWALYRLQYACMQSAYAHMQTIMLVCSLHTSVMQPACFPILKLDCVLLALT